ncbi:hypothetical protein TRIUR3_23813 [Triticum urartu]|uniref:Uncharacterized protein n=1 Tax=Triticum urartu TaxID=4572 RepID=M7YK99_TRIUA|nr:hypothetical protein TRIUR3_23813 [Triticum urartu]
MVVGDLVISAYASQVGHNESTKRDFWEGLEEGIVRSVPICEKLFIGHLNSHVGTSNTCFGGMREGFGYGGVRGQGGFIKDERREGNGPLLYPIEMWRGLGDIAIVWLPIFKNKGSVQSCTNYRGVKLKNRTMNPWERVIEHHLRMPSVTKNHLVSCLGGRAGFWAGLLKDRHSIVKPEPGPIKELAIDRGHEFVFFVQMGFQDTLSSSSDEEDIEQSCDGNKVLQRCLNGSFDSLEQEIRKCLNGASDTPKELVDQDVKQPANRNGRGCLESQTDSEGEPQKCMNEEPGVSLEAICSKVQLAPSETGECCMNSQADCPTSPVANSGQSPQFITNEQSSTPNFKKLKTSSEPDASLEVTNTKVQLAPNENGECCMNSQADCPTSPVANSGQSPQFLTDEQSSPPSFKKLKTSSEHASVKPTGTVSEATMKLRELVNKVKTSSEHVSVKPTGTVSEATMKLQELVNKIRRAQDLLQSVDYAPSSIVLAPWKFQENNPWQKRN